MGSLNKILLIGNLGRDAELRYTPGGAAVAKFSIATTETWNDKSGQRQERTEWHNVDLWGKQAESLAEYLVKGKQVYIEGRIQTDEYTDKEGVKRKATKVRCDRVVLLGGGRGGDGEGRGRRRGRDEHDQRREDEIGGEAIGGELEAGGTEIQPLADDDIPF